MNGNTVFIPFEDDFAALLGETPVVTVTPVGSPAQLYIESIEKNGFKVAVATGTANIQFSWIAVGKRIDADEKPGLPAVVADNDFDENIRGVMFNESNMEQSATPVWWDGTRVRFDPIPDELQPGFGKEKSTDDPQNQ